MPAQPNALSYTTNGEEGEGKIFESVEFRSLGSHQVSQKPAQFLITHTHTDNYLLVVHTPSGKRKINVVK